MLRRWWVKKYQIPWTSSYFQESTLLELLIEFMEDYYENNKSELFHDSLDADGNVVFDTGDPLIDKWEQEIAKGLSPDLLEGMDRQSFERTMKKIAESKDSSVGSFEEFSDNYASGTPMSTQIKKLRNAGMI